MEISPNQAAESLKAIDATTRRSAVAYSYAHSSPYFIMWGVIWMLGYGATDLWPHGGGAVWLPLTLVGVVGSFVIGRRQGSARYGHQGSTPASSWRFLAMFVAIFAFVAATETLFRPATQAQQAAFVPLLMSLAYVLVGIWRGPRYLITGIAVATLTLAGFYLLHEHFMLWMAGVGGGSLVLAGLWLRQV
jgi:hypothetical protein